MALFRRRTHRTLPARPTDRPVFTDPSGVRWRRLRRAGLLLAVVVTGLTAFVVPRVLAPPALPTGEVPDAPSAGEIGSPAVVGDGPLVRLVRVVPADGTAYAQDPFTGEVVSELGPDGVRAAGGARYVLERYGYGDAGGRTISLTFDDGPDPIWTPRLLDLLSRHGVPATFFVTGEQAARYPEIVQRMTREGFAVGNHTLTHVDVDRAAPLRQQLELVLTDRMLRGLTGRFASYFRPPYEGDDDESLRKDVGGILRAQQLGYAVAGSDFDSSDWNPAVAGRNGGLPLPPLGRQEDITVLMHDAGGGDKTATLEYVERLIPLAREAGYRFTTMPQANPELAEHTGSADVTVEDRVAVAAANAFWVLPRDVLHGLFLLAVISILGVGVLNILMALLRRLLVRRRAAAGGSWLAPGVSVLIAAYNEEAVIARTLGTVLASSYPVHEVVVVDDGSSDGTAAAVRAVAARDARVRLVRQANAGKWAALNRGMREVREEIVVTLDADTVFEPGTIAHLVAPFRSPRVGAVAGVVKVGNRSRNVLTRWQALEYLTQIGIDRAAAALVNAVVVVPGACAAWRRTAVLEVGGYSDATLAEDCDLTLLLHRRGWRVEQADGAVAWTEAPETLDALLTQRSRWMFGTVQAVWRHRSMLLRPRYGWLGMVALPMTVLTLVVPLLFTPLVAAVILQTLVDQGPLPVLGYLALFSIVQAVTAVVAVALLRERPVHLLVVPIYRLVFEPLRAYLLYAAVGTALRGVRLGWGKLARTAHLDAVPAPAPRAPALAPVAAPAPAAALLPVPTATPAERAKVPA